MRFDLARARGASACRRRAWSRRSAIPQDQRKISLIAVHAHGIPDEFPDAVLAEVERLEAPKLAGRTDLRALDLLTIDPVDARDHDDAVHAAPDTDAANRGGWIVHVAIADVAHYVRARHAARPRGAAARQLGLLPRPRRADAARAHIQRPVLAEGARGARLPRRAHGVRPARQQEEPHLPARHDALGRQALLRGGAGRHRRAPERQDPAAAGARAQAAVGRLRRAGRRPRPARAARPRPARAQDRDGRAGPGRARGDAGAAHRAPPDRGVHDPGQRGRGRGAGGQARACHLPGARCALQGEARWRCATSWRAST